VAAPCAEPYLVRAFGITAAAAWTQSTHWCPTEALRMHSPQIGRPHRVQPT
jgi:hypothetical protein